MFTDRLMRLMLRDIQSELATIALEMGAEHQLSLTSDVTHLIIGETNTPKYKYVAREREDIKAVRAEWLLAVREAWISADDIDLAALEEAHRWKPFEGMALCITGFHDCNICSEYCGERTDVCFSDLSRSATRNNRTKRWPLPRRSYSKCYSPDRCYDRRKEIRLCSAMGYRDGILQMAGR